MLNIIDIDQKELVSLPGHERMIFRLYIHAIVFLAGFVMPVPKVRL